MPRVARINHQIPGGIYHVISRTAVETFFSDYEKDMLLKIIQRLSRIYFVKVYGYCLMGNHFHLIVQMVPPVKNENGELTLSPQAFRQRHKAYIEGCVFSPRYKLESEENKLSLISKWSDLSEFMKEIKLSFTRWYNPRHARRGFLWGGRFKSVLLEKGQALLNCMAYVDLNPVRAGLCDKPEQYRWNSLYHYAIRRNKDGLLSLDYAEPIGVFPKSESFKERFRFYREWIYLRGQADRIELVGGEVKNHRKISEKVFQMEKQKGFKYSIKDCFLHRCRYFSDALIVGSHSFVEYYYGIYKDRLLDKRVRRFPRIKAYTGIYSMRELRKEA